MWGPTVNFLLTLRMPEKINLKEEKLFGLRVSVQGSLTLLRWVVVGQYIIAEMW